MSLGFRFLKSILSIIAFTHGQNDPGIIREKKKKTGKFHQGALAIILFLVSLAGITLKLKKVSTTISSFNPCPSLLSVHCNRKQEMFH